jgi:5-methylcytosine-specific restriction endonuclease McrA
VRQVWQSWQIIEGGQLVKVTGPHPWYTRAKYGWKVMRLAEMQRNPVCTRCERRASEIVDHKVPFITPEGIVSWALFSDPANHRAQCRKCDSKLTSTFDGGFGNERKVGKETYCQPTGETGKIFASTSLGAAALDKALDFDVDDLLKGIPD